MAHPSFAKFKKLRAEAQALLAEKDVEFHDDLPRSRKFVHFWALVGKSFARNRCPVRAAALAYTTLLALVPLLAVVVSVSTGFLKKEEGEQRIRAWISTATERIAPMVGLLPKDTIIGPTAQDATQDSNEQEKLVSQIMTFIRNFQSGALGVTAVLALVFVAISLLATIEATLNDMWGVTHGRGWFSRTVQYWAAITLGPLLLLLAGGFSSWTRFEAGRKYIEGVYLLGDLVLSHAVPFVILSLAFALFYLLMPNTKVAWRAALVGGMVAGGLLHLNSNLNFLYVSRVVTYKQIYGSLAILPLFLLALYLSWLILLFGAQTAYAFQNRRAYIQERQAERINQKGREFVALRLMTHIGQRFQSGESPPTCSKITEEVGVPLRLASQILGILVETKLLVEVAGEETGYAPARPLDRISAQDILQALRSGHGQELATSDNSVRTLVRKEFDAIENAERGVAGALSLQALVEQAKALEQADKPREALG
jgi:membrane protein